VAYMYFDSITYPWHIKEARELHEVLYSQITAAGEIDRIRACCGPHVAQLAHGAPDAMWRGLLNAVAIAGCLRDLDAVLREQQLPHVHAALDKLVNAASPDSERWILEQRIFVNRIRLRKALATLAGENTTERVLLVRGEKASGKTWTRHIIQHYAHQTGQKCIYLYAATATTVQEAVNQICVGLGGMAPANFSTDSAWYRQVALHMMGLAQAKECGAWIIMDDLGLDAGDVSLIDPEICKFFDVLALFTADPNFAKWFRLILISYPDEKPVQWKEECFIEDRTAVSDLQEPEIKAYLSHWAQKKGKTLTESQAMALSEAIMQKASAPPAGSDKRSRLKRMHDELASVLDTL
jgi:hypothetical protein